MALKKTARYDGPHPTIDVYAPDGRVFTVKQGEQLPDDVPAALRDELLERDDWSEPGTKKPDHITQED